MIQIGGSAQRSFVFPAPLLQTYAYYADLPRMFHFLSHIRLVHSGIGGRYRLLYHHLESGLYQVQIYCDVGSLLDEERCTIDIRPLQGVTPVEPHAGLYSMTGQGRYTSQITFHPHSRGTLVDYSLEIRASLPIALTLRWIPGRSMDTIAQRNFELHTSEIIEDFIDQSIRAYHPN